MRVRNDRPSHDRRNHGDRDRTKLLKREIVAGHMFYLPERKEICHPSLQNCLIDPKCFGHPVLMLTVEHTDEVKFLIITSFRDKGLDERIKDPVRRRNYLPIHPSPPHEEADFITLHLSGSEQLEKRSWVNAANELTADWRILRPFRLNGKGPICLKKAARRALLRYMADRNFGSRPQTGAVPPAISGGSQKLLLLPTPPSSPVTYQGPRAYDSVAHRPTTIVPYKDPYTSPYTPPSPPSSGPRRPSPMDPAPLWIQNSLTSFTPRLPGSFPLTDTQRDGQIIFAATRYHHHHVRERETLLPTARMATRTAPRLSQTQGCSRSARVFLLVATLLLVAYALYGLYWFKH
ncbi:hypothetical protein CLAIMM_00172 [Cladophialophora immunda]|nr:hypothetical protein CLAIMM_00172 [Cladophialophora immunda]